MVSFIGTFDGVIKGVKRSGSESFDLSSSNISLIVSHIQNNSTYSMPLTKSILGYSFVYSYVVLTSISN